jgi:CBS domain-containing protein
LGDHARFALCAVREEEHDAGHVHNEELRNMVVGDILAEKGRSVHAVLPWTPVAEAVAKLGRLGIGALLVRDADGGVAGIVSERDVVRRLAAHGAEILDCRVDDVMTREVQSVRPDEPVARAMERMTRGRFRHLPVVTDGAVVGMVSIGDLVRHRVREMELETGVLRDLVVAAH